MYYKTAPYRVFTIFNTVFVGFISLLCILPMIHILAVSFSDKAAVSGNLVNFWPIGFNLDAYDKTIANHLFISSLWISVKRVIFGTLLSMIVVILAAYPLSKESGVLKARATFAWYFVFTMLFSGGLVPSYILVSKLHLNNTMWALILPGAVSVWNMILLMNFFRNVPKELEEAALIDGANQLQTLWKIYLPISMPALATLSLFTLVGHWNSWFDGLIYMTRPENYPLATYLQTVVVSHNLKDLITNVNDAAKLTQRSVQAAQIFIASIPILLVYPFLQRYFVKGMVLGAVKE
ncbi:carbohydrate ABC transporter permease [Paenibacillus psychroresistens]|uniref:Carbohydrate ABC transporter permease n=1 Tax=Paenibacillus psychroresistens TaxID=1778678 RepID=A0A6B8RFA9_9BACL|nr:carbohydrate ABC transporter permease [Paenibacillus psychroresistens]QGQ95171.1 carbohydrate ABC transporter permease [Paenibacillus psychroresistens]